jgi:glycosyltransferase involved in cell wall biosynthesis
VSNTTSIVLPVYGRSELLEPALASVIALDKPDWQLLIADDGSDLATQQMLESWLSGQGDPRIHWIQRPRNLGLFANLNRAIHDAETDWVLLLCSDDLLLPSALSTIHELQNNWPKSELIISTHLSINGKGEPRAGDSAWHHDQVSRRTAVINPERFVPALLKLGSLNGNLTGMAFTRKLWQHAGPFREDWRHAADWDWLLRATERNPVLLNRKPIAKVRTHATQLSNSNRRGGNELQEVAAVVTLLREHRLVINENQRDEWAAHIMQHQLRNTLKMALTTKPVETIRRIRAVQRAAGISRTLKSMLKSTGTKRERTPRKNSRETHDP